jgi:hypothetical protein
MEIEFRFNHNNLQYPESKGELIQTSKLKLNDIENGMFNYCEAEFDSPYYSKLNFTVMGYITTFKFTKFEPEIS